MSHPRLVGRYCLLKTLGEGAFSKVKLAQNIDSGKTFAVKIIDKSQIRQNNLEIQLRREKIGRAHV
jgi:5'-AMP-activated protein kinase catalytic alpha subunit